MLRTLRKASLALLVLAIIAVIFAGFVWWSIRTEWFAHAIKARLITSLQDASGGRVELGKFSFDPNTLNARAEDLVVHGTEPAGSHPLLSIASVEIRIKILSLWRRDIDVQSVILNRPEVQLLINADGNTNIPRPKVRNTKSPVEQLLDLKAARLEVNDGMVRVDDRKLPVHFISQALALALNYQLDGPSYGVDLRTDVISALRPLHIETKARLLKDRADVDRLQLVSGKGSSELSLSGRIEHFAQPMTADGKLDGSISIDELAQFGNINDNLRGGRVKVSGGVHYELGSGNFRFEGHVHADGVDFVSPEFTLRNVAGDSEVVATNAGMLLRNVEAAARGAHFSGEGSIKYYQWLTVDGRVSQVALREVGSYLTNEPFPWSGVAHGTAHATARLRKQSDLVIGAKVQVDAGNSGVPASGTVDVTFSARSGDVEFGDSQLQLPHTALSFHGSLDRDLTLKADSSNAAEIAPVIPMLGGSADASDLPVFASGGSAHFEGVLHNAMTQPVMQGDAAFTRFQLRRYDWDALSGQFVYSAGQLQVSQFQLQGTGATLNGSGTVPLAKGRLMREAPLQLKAQFASLNLIKTAALFGKTLPVIQGMASGSVDVEGTANAPRGRGHFQIADLDAYGEQLNQVRFDAVFDGQQIRVNKGRVESGPAALTFAGTYKRAAADWTVGDIDVTADSNGFPLASLSTMRKVAPKLNADAELHLEAAGKIRGETFEPAKVNGRADLRGVSIAGRALGRVSLHAATQGQAIRFDYTGDLRGTKFHGSAEAKLTSGTPVKGQIQMDRLNLATLKDLFTKTKMVLPVNGFLEGEALFDGLLQEPANMHAQAKVRRLQLSSEPQATLAATPLPEIVLSNNDPIVVDVYDGALHITKFEIDGRDTSVKVTGTAPFTGSQPIDIKAVGKADLALFMLFDPNARSAGSSEIAVNISGSMADPNVTGTLAIKNGSFFLPDLPNGLSELNGAVVFGRNRATIQKMTAHSGGGDISLGGTLSFSAGTPLVYHLEAAARNVRVRYANSISVTANSDLRLSGTSASSIVSGTLTVTRVVFTPNADAGNLLAAASFSTSAPSDQGDFISGLHLDINVESAPNLQVSTNLSRDVEAEIQLSLRGTPDHPILLGNITANQGDLKIFGTRFSLNRGEVTFVNTVRIEPVLDLDLETQARGVTVDITVSGAPSKLNFNYRSDPPLQPRDIIALLTVGRAPDLATTSNTKSGSDVSALKSGVNSVLGQAISPVSNRLSKLFGITNIKIDPFVQGITNTPQARLSVEQQISRDVTITYVTNLSQTSEQIFRFEWALSRQFSIVALRDDNGEFGIDFQYKKRFK